jgi:hypothetical protein
MRALQIAFIVLVGMSMEATAGPRSGGGSSGGHGGGRLASVSAGIATATRASGGSHARGGSSYTGQSLGPCPYDQYHRRVYDGACERRCPPGEIYRLSEHVCVRRTVAVVVTPVPEIEAEEDPSQPSGSFGTAHVSAYVGAQKVFESDGALAVELAISDRRLRLDGGLTRFYEQQATGDTLTLTMPSLALGLRLNNDDATRVYLEGGVVGAMTRNDPMAMDSSITGAIGGVVAEHSLSKQTMLVGAAKVMRFSDDIRAASIRAGVRFHHVQASFSVLDFNVGPALYGPELGVGF